LFLFSGLDPRSTPLDIIFPLAVMAFGLGFGMAQRTNIIAAVVPESEIGSASSVLALGRNIAGAFGIAVFGTILSNSIGAKILQINSLSSLNSTLPTAKQEFVSLIILKAQIASYNKVFIISSGVVFIGGLLALLIKVKKESKIKVEAEF
jgi:hypothetical protein